jgi:hypothetical protein
MRLALALTLCFSAALSAAEFFVDPKGDDTRPGTKEAPFATLGRALKAAAAGDTITLREGEHEGGQTIATANLTLRAHEGERPRIKVPNDVERRQNALWVQADGVTLRGLEIQGGYYYALKFELGVKGGLAEDCRIHGSGRDCVKIAGADDITLRRCEIFNSGQRDNSNAEGIDNVNGDRMLVQDCHIHDIATCGVYPKGGSIGSVIERCFITRCGQAGISLAQASGLEFYDHEANPEFYSCRDCVARNNIIVDIKGSGIDLESALRPRVLNNTLVNVAQTMRAGIRITGNNKGGAAGCVRCKDAEVRNNIIVVAEAGRRPVIAMGADAHEGTLAISHNRYHKPGAKPLFWWEPTGAYNLDLAGWVKFSGETGSSVGDPGLDASWHLGKDSPCAGAGLELKDVADDYDGQERQKKWDVGADQRGKDPLATPPPAGVTGTGRPAEPERKPATGRQPR